MLPLCLPMPSHSSEEILPLSYNITKKAPSGIQTHAVLVSHSQQQVYTLWLSV